MRIAPLPPKTTQAPVRRPVATPLPALPQPGPVATVGQEVHTLAEKASNFARAMHAWAQVFRAIATGKTTLLPGQLPPYATLDSASLAAGLQAGLGQTIRQEFSTGDRAGHELADPVNLIVHGSREAVTRALTSQGWVQASPRSVGSYVRQGLSVLFFLGRDNAGPVSEQYLDGRGEDLAFNKNSDYNLARDHMRLFYKGKDANGQDTWAIAATRDTAVSLELPHPTLEGLLPHLHAPSIGHDTDKAIDGERDQIMQNLLASGQVKGWAAIKGLRSGAPETRLPDGRYQVGPYTTDGRVYDVVLNGQ